MLVMVANYCSLPAQLQMPGQPEAVYASRVGKAEIQTRTTVATEVPYFFQAAQASATPIETRVATLTSKVATLTEALVEMCK
jgi:hypothetical protein